MAEDNSFADLMLRLRAGDGDAARRVFDRFARRLIGLARRRLDDRLRRKVDPEDVLQSVYESFFRRHANGQFDLGNWDSLWALLTLMTVRKCGRWAERYQTARRAAAAEVPLAAVTREGEWAVLDRDPTPPEAAALTETLEAVMAELEEHERHILALHLRGCEVADLSAQVGCSERTVQRVLQRVRCRLERLLAEGR